jgi:hypothetical protein
VNILSYVVLFVFLLIQPMVVLADPKPTEPAKPAILEKEVPQPVVEQPAKSATLEKTDPKPTDKQSAEPTALAKTSSKPVDKQCANPATTAKVKKAKKRAKKPATRVAKRAKTAKPPAVNKKPESLVIGKNLSVGMPLNEAIKLLGIPGTINVKRGTESKLDSISIAYPMHGIVLHSLNKKRKIEALEVLPQFKGSFVEGVKIGVQVTALIEKYGVPQSMNANLAKYPEKGMYFSLKENMLVAAHVFEQNSKILSHQLYKNRR